MNVKHPRVGYALADPAMPVIGCSDAEVQRRTLAASSAERAILS